MMRPNIVDVNGNAAVADGGGVDGDGSSDDFDLADQKTTTKQQNMVKLCLNEEEEREK